MFAGSCSYFPPSVSLRIVNRTPSMNHYVMLCEAMYYIDDEMCALVAHEFYRAFVTTPDILV
jgi:hypothetical protein